MVHTIPKEIKEPMNFGIDIDQKGFIVYVNDVVVDRYDSFSIKIMLDV